MTPDDDRPPLPPASSGELPVMGTRELRPPLLESEKLFQGHRAVEISHNGVLYRLQATRLGKLILTK